MTLEEHPSDGDAPRGAVSVRAQLSRAMLLVLLIALLPSIVAMQYLRTMERAASVPVASSEQSMQSGELPLTSRATRNTITVAFLSTFAAALVVVYTPVALLRTIGRMTSILKQAESGNLNVAVAGSQVKELSTLAVAVNRTLGRLKHFDSLKAQRVREEQRLVEALFAVNTQGLALVNPQAKIVRRNLLFRELVEGQGEDCSGKAVGDVFGAEAHDAVRRVQRDRDVVMISWTRDADGRPRRLTFSPVKDEVDTPPRLLLTVQSDDETASDRGSTE